MGSRFTADMIHLHTSQNQARVNSGWHAIRGVGVALGGGVFGPNPVWTDKAAKVVRGLAKRGSSCEKPVQAPDLEDAKDSNRHDPRVGQGD